MLFFPLLTSLICLATVQAGDVKEQVFCAMDQLAELVYKQGNILQELIEINRNFMNKSDYFSRKLKTWHDEQLLAQKDVTKYITNPLNAFILIKRTSEELKLIENYLTPNLNKKLQELWGKRENIVGAVEGLLRLQVTYKLSSKDFANGIIMGRKVREPFSAHDLFSFGSQALNLKIEWIYPRSEDYFAIEYLEMALDKVLNGGDPDKEVSFAALVSTLAGVYRKVGHYKKCYEVIDKLPTAQNKYADLRMECLSLYVAYGLSKLHIEDPYDETIHHVGAFNWRTDEIYTAQTCRGDRTLSIAEQSRLRCRYISNSPFSKIAPFRVEELYDDPFVHLYYDVLFDSEIELIKNMSGVKLERGTNFLVGKQVGYSERRITKTTFVDDKDHEVLNRIGQRAKDMTGLTSLMKKRMQVQNYGVAGYIHAHWDSSLPEATPVYEEWGNRFGTVLFYLSDVELGGYTVFPFVGARANATKGTAIFWYSTTRSGETELLMRHASCPVLLGSKWVANRWFYEKGNEFTYSCLPNSYKGIKVQDFYDKYY